MSWKNSNLNDPISQITELRVENTKYRVQLQSLRKQNQPLNSEIAKLSSRISQYNQRQIKIKNQLIRIGVVINCTQMYRIGDLGELLDTIERKVVQNKEKITQMERDHQKISMSRSKEQFHSENQRLLLKQKQIELTKKSYEQKCQQNKRLLYKISQVTKQLQQLYQQMNKKDIVLGQLSHKVSQLEIQKKDFQQQLKNIRQSTSNKSQKSSTVKKQCQQLLNFINVRDDDYLKSFLLKNCRFQNNHMNTTSKKNKYDFIFQN